MPMSPKSFRMHPKPKKQEKRYASRNTEYRHWYQLPAWKSIRRTIFERDNHLCQECLRKDILKPVKEHTTRDDVENQGHADHIVPHNGDWERFVDLDGIELLCARCHSRKTIKEQHGRN